MTSVESKQIEISYDWLTSQQLFPNKTSVDTSKKKSLSYSIISVSDLFLKRQMVGILTQNGSIQQLMARTSPKERIWYHYYSLIDYMQSTLFEQSLSALPFIWSALCFWSCLWNPNKQTVKDPNKPSKPPSCNPLSNTTTTKCLLHETLWSSLSMDICFLHIYDDSLLVTSKPAVSVHWTYYLFSCLNFWLL